MPRPSNLKRKRARGRTEDALKVLATIRRTHEGAWFHGMRDASEPLDPAILRLTFRALDELQGAVEELLEATRDPRSRP